MRLTFGEWRSMQLFSSQSVREYKGVLGQHEKEKDFLFLKEYNLILVISQLEFS